MVKKLFKTQPSFCLSTQQYISFKNVIRLLHFLLTARSFMLCVAPGAGFGAPNKPLLAEQCLPPLVEMPSVSCGWKTLRGKKGLKQRQKFNIVQPLRGCLWAAISLGMDPAKSFTRCKHFSRGKAHKISEKRPFHRVAKSACPPLFVQKGGLIFLVSSLSNWCINPSSNSVSKVLFSNSSMKC